MLDRYFKQYFWTFILGVVGLAGLLVASMFSVVAAERIRLPPGERPSAQLAAGADATKDRKSGVPVSAFLDKNVFKAQREDLEEAERLRKQAEEDAAKDNEPELGDVDLANCSKSAMAKNLVATVVTSDDSRSVAVFAGAGKDGATEAFYVGDKLDDATIRRVLWRRVLVDNAGRCEYFTMEAEDPNAALASAATVAPVTPEGGDDKGQIELAVKKLGESEFEIPRGDIDNVLSNLSSVATQARIVPSFQNGKPNGFKLFSIRPGSLYSKIGIQNGDVIQKINGYEMNDPAKAFDIYSKLKDSPAITVDLVRRGKTQTMTYNIR